MATILGLMNVYARNIYMRGIESNVGVPPIGTLSGLKIDGIRRLERVIMLCATFLGRDSYYAIGRGGVLLIRVFAGI